MRAIVVAIAILLAGCAGAANYIEGSGKRVKPPPGWVEYCERNPTDPSCS